MTPKVFLCLAFACLVPLSVGAEENRVKIELNKLEAQSDACQAFILIENGSGTAFDSLSLDLVLFDVEGVIARRLAVEMAPLRVGKTSVKVFGIDGLSCDAIGRILVNDVLSCKADGVDPTTCLDMIETTSRAPADFIS
ncbi:MAG: Tat pathway signal sequence domain protein [Pseudomonadota bacterium]